MIKLRKPTEDGIKSKLKTFIENQFLLEDNSFELADNDSLMEKGIIDSTGVLELVNFIEETFGITVEDDELIPDNLDSINNMITFIKKKV